VNYNKCVKLDPANADAWLGIGVVLDALNRLTESVHYIKKAIEINTNEPDYWYVFAEIQEKYGIKFSLWIFTLTAVLIILRRLRVFVLIYFIFGWNKKDNIKKDINFNKKTDLHSEIQFNEEIKKKENFQNNIPKKEWVNIESNIDGTITIESKDIIKKDIKDNIELYLNRKIELKKDYH
jgi:tetratricopeptide (TPR) repeat protein